jgi:hypothetical protein
VKFEWTSKCEKIFQQLNEILTSVTILNIANSEYFVVYIIACKEGIDEVLSEKNYVVSYDSRKLK